MVKNISVYQVSTDAMSCEPLIRRMPNGELLCVCQHGDLVEPSPKNREYAYHSTDNGRTWSKRELIYPEDGNAVYCTALSVVGDEVTAYLSVHNGGFLDSKCYMMKSRDNGYSWKNCGNPPYFPEYTFIRSPIFTSNGTHIIPYHTFPITREAHDRVLNDPNLRKFAALTGTPECETGVLISRDMGKSYTRHTACIFDMTERGWSWAEPTIAELPDGSITMLMRSECTGRLWRSDSKDGGITWSSVSPTDIPNPTNKPMLINIDNNRIALFNTPNGDIGSTGHGKRSPYEMWISDDGMKTWCEKIRLTDFPGEYHYTDGFYEDGHIRTVVEHNRHTILHFDIEL